MGTKAKQFLLSVRILLMIILQLVGQYSLVCEGVRSYQMHAVPTYGGNPPVKTIKHSNGDVVDCVDFYDQPAFEHPLLKDQKIKGKLALRRGNPASAAGPVMHDDHVQLNTEKICPKGTVPILRQAMERGSNANPGGSLKHALSSLALTAEPTQKSQGLISIDAQYWGEDRNIQNINATISIWNPFVEDNQSSLMYIAALNNDNGARIKVGWTVNQPLFGDNKTRLFVSWSDGGYGCVNLLCPGFVQTSTTSYLGASLHPVSEIGGEIFEDDFSLKRSDTGDWLVSFHGYQLGYFTAALIPSLTGEMGVTAVIFGGTVNLVDSGGGPDVLSEMGSGAFPFRGVRQACYMRNLHIYGRDLFKGEASLESLESRITNNDLYGVGKSTEGSPFGKAGEPVILIGGPGTSAVASPPPP